jgi:tripartite-type tricarboxylate transporter receptor subunit TctC
MMRRYSLLLLLLILLLPLLLLSPGCRGESAETAYPTKPVTIVCPWAAGGGTDRVARFWADALQRELKMPFLVANRTGGAGAVGHRSGANARPDGHTLTIITFELCTMHHMNVSSLTFRDFACLMQVNADPAAIIVRHDAPWKNLRELLDEMRKRPGQLSMSGTARGGAWDLARIGLMQAYGLDPDDVLWIPTQGSAPSLVELLGGHIDVVCCSVPEVAASMDQLRVLAVMADERLPQYSQIPTAREAGVDWSAVGWRGFAAPKDTPPHVLEKLLAAASRIGGSPEYAEFMDKNGFAITMREGPAFLDFLAQQDAQWATVIEAANRSSDPTAQGDPGPWALPWLTALIVVVCAIWEFFFKAGGAIFRAPRGFFGARRATFPAPGAADGSEPLPVERLPFAWSDAVVLALIGGYVFLLPKLGFSALTAIGAALFMRRQGTRWPLWSLALVSMVLVVFIKLLFEYTFGVQLPEGIDWRNG